MIEAEQIMKRCQAGTRNYEEANNLHAACYGIIGKLLAQRKLLTDEKICLIAHNTDPNDWDDLTFKKCWHEGFKAGFREAEIEHNIKG